MENEEVYFTDLPDEEYIDRIGDAVDELVKQGIISPLALIDTDELDKFICVN